MREKSFIKSFQIEDKHYIYDVNKNSFFQTDELFSHLLAGNYNATDNIESYIIRIQEMKEKGFLSENRPEITFFHHKKKEVFLDDLRLLLNRKLGRITLVLTEKCNLRCRYCVYSGKYRYHRKHSARTMSEEVMKKAVDFYFSHSRDNEEKNISFYGGEPLLNFGLLKKCVRYVRGKHSESTNFNMTINGTMLNEDIIHFLVEHRFSLLISIDGPGDIHNRNRVFKNGVGSFRRVFSNLKKFKSIYPDYYKQKVRFNMVLSPPFEPEKIDEFISNPEIAPSSVSFSRVSRQFTSYHDLFPSDRWDDYLHQLKKLHRSLLNKLEKGEALRPFEKYFLSKRYLFIHQRKMDPLPSKYPSHGQCILGSRALLVNTDGSFNFCTQIDDVYKLGNVFSGFNYGLIGNLYLQLEELFRSNCCDCWAIRLCMKCIKDLNRGGIISMELLKAHCKYTKRTLLNDIKEYIRIREKNHSAFNYLDDVVVQ